MPGSAEFHHNEATRCADAAEQFFGMMKDPRLDPSKIDPSELTATATIAQVFATLALAHRTAEQTATLASSELTDRLVTVAEQAADNIGTTIWRAFNS